MMRVVAWSERNVAFDLSVERHRAIAAADPFLEPAARRLGGLLLGEVGEHQHEAQHPPGRRKHRVGAQQIEPAQPRRATPRRARSACCASARPAGDAFRPLPQTVRAGRRGTAAAGARAATGARTDRWSAAAAHRHPRSPPGCSERRSWRRMWSNWSCTISILTARNCSTTSVTVSPIRRAAERSGSLHGAAAGLATGRRRSVVPGIGHPGSATPRDLPPRDRPAGYWPDGTTSGIRG